MSCPDEQAEFSRPYDVARLGRAAEVRSIAATPEERAALARRLDLLSLDLLEAQMRVRRRPGTGLVEVRTRYRADLSQACVVTLEPVPAHLEETFVQLYDTAMPREAMARRVDVDAELEDPPEPVGPQGIDLGEAVVQHLAVALDPYPRAPDARMDMPQSTSRSDAGGEEETARENPFRVLRELKPRG